MTHCTKVPQILWVTILRPEKKVNNYINAAGGLGLQVGIHIIILLLLPFTSFCLPSLMTFNQLGQVASFFGHAHKFVFQEVTGCRSLQSVYQCKRSGGISCLVPPADLFGDNKKQILGKVLRNYRQEQVEGSLVLETRPEQKKEINDPAAK